MLSWLDFSKAARGFPGNLETSPSDIGGGIAAAPFQELDPPQSPAEASRHPGKFAQGCPYYSLAWNPDTPAIIETHVFDSLVPAGCQGKGCLVTADQHYMLAFRPLQWVDGKWRLSERTKVVPHYHWAHSRNRTWEEFLRDLADTEVMAETIAGQRRLALDPHAVIRGETENELPFRNQVKYRSLRVLSRHLTGPTLSRIAQCDSLEKVELCGASVDDSVLAVVCRLPGLRDLTIRHARMNRECMEYLGRAHWLERIHLDTVAISDTDFSLISFLPAVREFEISASPIGGGGLRHLASWPHLSSLAIKDIALSEDAIQSINEMPRLERLTLKNAGIDDYATGLLQDAAALRILNLDGNPITGGVWSALSRFASLTRLSLCNTKITNSPVDSWCDLSRLESLYLANTPLTDDIAGTIVRMSSLVTLDVRGTKMTANGIKMLQITLPRCRIMW